jgi:hypothetical protein
MMMMTMMMMTTISPYDRSTENRISQKNYANMPATQRKNRRQRTWKGQDHPWAGMHQACLMRGFKSSPTM